MIPTQTFTPVVCCDHFCFPLVLCEEGRVVFIGRLADDVDS